MPGTQARTPMSASLPNAVEPSDPSAGSSLSRALYHPAPSEIR